MAVAYARRSFNGGAIATTVPNGIGASDTSFTLTLATNWSFANNFYVDVDRGLPTEEKILCSGISGLTVTVASGGRGADGSSAVQHLAGCTIQVVHVAQDDDEANQVVSGILGQSGVAKGDMSYILSAAGPNTLMRLPIGSAGQLIGVSAGVPFWTSLTAAQVEPVFTAANQILLGTGSGTGTLASLTAGYGITGFVANPPSPTVALSTASGSLGANVTLTANAVVDVLTTASLAVGTWDVTMCIDIRVGTSAANNITALVRVGTATATFTGATCSQTALTGGSGGFDEMLSFSFIAVVTVAGTIKLSAHNYDASVAGTAEFQDYNSANSGVTGYKATRVA